MILESERFYRYCNNIPSVLCKVSRFREKLAQMNLTGQQLGPLGLRLQLIESLLLRAGMHDTNLATFQQAWSFTAGSVTIIDLSDPFVSANDACALFSCCVKIFMNGWKTNPRLIALDEAHKASRLPGQSKK